MALARRLRPRLAAWQKGGEGDGSGERRSRMLYYALIFLVVGLVAGALGLMGVAAVASQISWILFLIGIVMLAIHLARGGPRHPASVAGPTANIDIGVNDV
jgi:uncharacterized membrane protein YtjA (UPF0391 family)